MNGQSTVGTITMFFMVSAHSHGEQSAAACFGNQAYCWDELLFPYLCSWEQVLLLWRKYS